jgi:hypothetical protein
MSNARKAPTLSATLYDIGTVMESDIPPHDTFVIIKAGLTQRWSPVSPVKKSSTKARTHKAKEVHGKKVNVGRAGETRRQVKVITANNDGEKPQGTAKPHAANKGRKKGLSTAEAAARNATEKRSAAAAVAGKTVRAPTKPKPAATKAGKTKIESFKKRLAKKNKGDTIINTKGTKCVVAIKKDGTKHARKKSASKKKATVKRTVAKQAARAATPVKKKITRCTDARLKRVSRARLERALHGRK